MIWVSLLGTVPAIKASLSRCERSDEFQPPRIPPNASVGTAAPAPRCQTGILFNSAASGMHSAAAINSLFALVFGALTASALDSAVDRAALLDLYASTDGLQWRNNSNWLSPSASMCSWFGVECSANCSLATAECRVLKVQLNRNGLQGTIPASLGNMTNLTGTEYCTCRHDF